MAGLLQQPIQRKLSAMLGADVTFDKLNLSLIGGVIEAAGVTVSSADKTLPPILTIGRVRAQVAVARALKGEFVVRSLTIEKPVVRFVRENGRTNLPMRDAAPPSGDDKDKDPADKSDKSSWTFDIEKILLVDGDVSARVDGREFSATSLLAELKRAGDGYELTLMSDAVSLIGSLRGSARIRNAADLTKIADAPLDADVQLGDLGQVKFTTPRLRDVDRGELTFGGGLSVGRLRVLLKQARA